MSLREVAAVHTKHWNVEIERASKLGVEVLTLEDDRYPHALRFIFDPPPLLYVRGRLERADLEAIAIVGSRDASPYGLSTAERLGRELAAEGVTVVSGLAIGIDAAAHRGALAAGGRTIAVLGSGIDRIYPLRHTRLAAEIAESGAVVSELPFGTPPLAHHFPLRNRIVCGLSLGVVVVEATEKSGSLITARLALEQGRSVLAVPGEAGLDRTRGVHRLIRRGATLVENVGSEYLASGHHGAAVHPRCAANCRKTRRRCVARPGTTRSPTRKPGARPGWRGKSRR